MQMKELSVLQKIFNEQKQKKENKNKFKLNK